MPCEDAPCCGCCGTDIYGTNQSGPDDPMDFYCDLCGGYHVVPFACQEPEDDEDEEYEDMRADEILADERHYDSYRMEM